MIKRMITILPLLSIIALFGCCDKDTPTPTPVPQGPETFPVEFIFVNHSNNLWDVVLRTYYYNKKENKTNLYDKAYSHDDPQRDSTIVISYNNGTIGSLKGFNVEIRTTINDTTTRSMYFSSTSNNYGDTIKKKEDGIEKFRWPEDSIRYIKTHDTIFYHQKWH